MKKSNEHWDLSIHDYNPNGICVIHVELNEAAAPVDWTYVYCNPAFAEMKGLPAEKLVGQRFYTLFPTASRKWLKPYYEAAYKNIPCELDEIAEEIGAYLHVDAVPTGNSGYCMCILHDVKKNIFEKIKQNEALETTLKKLEKERTLNRQVRQLSAAMGVEYSLAVELDLLNNSYEILECSRYTNQELARGGTIGELAVSGTCTVPDRQQAGQFARMLSRENLLRSFRTGTDTLSLRHKQNGRDGKVHWVETKVICTECSETAIRALLLGRCIDEEIEKQKLLEKTEEASRMAKQAEENYRILHKLIGSGMWRTELDENGRITRVERSREYRKMLGYTTREDPETQEIWLGRIHPDDRERCVRDMYEYLRDTTGKKKYDQEFRMRTKTGEYRWFRSTGYAMRRPDNTPYTFFGAFFDITAEKKEKELERQKNEALQKACEALEEMDAIHTTMKTGAWTVHYDENEKFESVEWSNAFRRILGFQSRRDFPDDIQAGVGRVHPDDIDRMRRELQNVITDTTGKLVYDTEFRFLTKTGGYRWIRSAGSIVRGKGGAPKTFYGIIMDIDERKKTGIALQNAVLEAKKANSAKTRFLRRMSHDIRTPLNGLLGMLTICEKTPTDAQKLYENCQKMRKAAEYLASLVNDVLDFSKLESGGIPLQIEAFDLNEMLHDSVAVVKQHVNDLGLQFITDPNQKLAHTRVIGSKQHLNRVLMNIAWNAIKYNRPSGTVEMKTKELSCDGTTAVYQFTCADTGIGMSEEFQKHMFEPFSQEDKENYSSMNGTGLGLSLVKEMVQQMNGSIACESCENKGTTFTVTIPLQVDTNYHEPQNEQPPRVDLTGKRVLLVEDNALNREIAQYMLEEEGMAVETAENGQTALEQFAQSQPGHYDLVIMDVMMPVMDGLTATRSLRALDRPDAKTVPIIGMSANAFRDDVEQGLAAGMTDYLAKPLDVQKTRQALAKVQGDDR